MPTKEIRPNPLHNRSLVVQGLIERGGAGGGKHKNKQDFERGHARAPKHKGRGYEEGMLEEGMMHKTSYSRKLSSFVNEWFSLLEDEVVASALTVGLDTKFERSSQKSRRVYLSSQNGYEGQILMNLEGESFGLMRISFFLPAGRSFKHVRTITVDVYEVDVSKFADRMIAEFRSDSEAPF